MRWTEQQLADHLARTGVHGSVRRVDTSDPPFAAPATPKARMQALGRLKFGEMNKTEAQYFSHLQQRLFAGDILWFKFEGIKLRLADNTFYTCDFTVLPADSVMEMHEVKGFWLDDARVKIKVAASLYPFRFKAVTPRAKKHGGGWEVEEF